MADIQSRIVALQTQQVGTATKAAKTTSVASGSEFASYLNEAVASQSPVTDITKNYQSPVNDITKNYKLNSNGVPTDLAAYGNGKIPVDALAKVGAGDDKLWAPAAESLNKMIADAKSDGVTIGINDSYRSYDEQVDMAARKGLYSQGGLAARPGTSEHGWGMAADLQLNSGAQSWMQRHGDEYGFVNNVPGESWHWAYKPEST